MIVQKFSVVMALTVLTASVMQDLSNPSFMVFPRILSGAASNSSSIEVNGTSGASAERWRVF